MKDKLVSFIFEVLLFIVFILCNLFIILIGTRVLDSTKEKSDTYFYNTLSLQYINNKIHKSDSKDLVSLKEVEGKTVLELAQKDSEYVTWIYYEDGLCELFSDPSYGLKLSDGIKVLDCDEFKFSRDDLSDNIIVMSGNKELRIQIRAGNYYALTGGNYEAKAEE